MRELGIRLAFVAATVFGVTTLSAQVAEAQYCQSNVECGSGFACQGGQCVQVGAQVQVQVQGQGGYQQQPAPPPPQGGYAQPQPYAQPQAVYQQQQRPTHTVTRPTWGLLGPGIGLLVGGYVAEIFVGLFGGLAMGFDSAVTGSSYDGNAFFYSSLIPVAGPIAQMAVVDFDDGWMPWLLLDTILQVGGLTMIILGAAIQQEVEVYAELDDGVDLAVLPTFGTDGAGLSATLRY
ncbi:MAG: hypothetical protein VYE22_03330 [Myxococcota bacterium]|nr:hypothetical protein [Myxococcota bacterium]